MYINRVHGEGISYVAMILFYLFFLVWKIKMRSDKSNWETWGPLETPKQWWGQGGTCFFLSLSFSHIQHIFSTVHPTTQQLSAFPSSNSLNVSDAHNFTMPRCCPLALYPLNPELSFITFLWSWEWKRWEKGERGGAESNMAAYLEDFLYWNMCKQFTHKGLK